ncbi:MAG: mannose-phosphate guanylyltransferase [Thermoplasmata archaeon]|jgi:mannose-1-phosphate guanylyltransferase|nr:mannose-phosphate guanylyltransferase [Thermoplasmata archaeon]
MKAVVMAGGEGTRLRPLTLDVPKPFLRVAGKPAIEYALDALVAAGVQDIIVTTFYKPERLIQHLAGGARLKARIFYSVEDEAMGTAGGVAKCAPLLGDDTVIVLSGDVIADVNVRALVDAHKRSGAVATMALTTVDNPTEFGIVGLDETGRIVRFKEKPKAEEVFSNLVNAGIYVLSPEALREVPQGQTFDFSKQLFPKLLESGRRLQGVPLEGFWMDVGRPADLLKASLALGQKHHGGTLREGAKVSPQARVARTDLYPGAAVEGSAHVEDCILYDGARVEDQARVTGTILAPDAVIGAGAKVADCVLGRGARVKPGATLTGERVQPGQTSG